MPTDQMESNLPQDLSKVLALADFSEDDQRYIKELGEKHLREILKNHVAQRPLFSGMPWSTHHFMAMIEAIHNKVDVAAVAKIIHRSPLTVTSHLVRFEFIDKAQAERYLKFGHELNIPADRFELALVRLINGLKNRQELTAKSESTEVVITAEIQQALDLVESRAPVLLVTGDGGSGKSVLIKLLVQKFSDREVVVVAPTGSAALNVDGRTINSLFSLPFDPTPETLTPLSPRACEVLSCIDILCIEEISMANAIVMDCIDMRMKQAKKNNAPFGGAQLVLVGDLFQITPVVTEKNAQALARYKTPFFFSSFAIRKLIQQNMFQCVQLTRGFRQADPVFKRMLRNIRSGADLTETVRWFNRNCYLAKKEGLDLSDAVHLVLTRAMANSINQKMMDSLPGESKTYIAQYKGSLRPGSTQINALDELTLKVGMRVVMTKNLKSKGYVNGTSGVVVGLGDDSVDVKIDTDGQVITVEVEEWQETALSPNNSGKLEETVVGTCRQIPIFLGAALTIHKAQGMTLNKAHIHFHKPSPGETAHARSKRYQAGQTYVALSRVRTKQGLSFEQPMSVSAVSVSQEAMQFYDYMGVDWTLAKVNQDIENASTTDLLENAQEVEPSV